MADSAKGKRSQHTYVAHRQGAPGQYLIYNSVSATFCTQLEAHELLKNRRIKICTPKGKDVTESLRKRAARHYEKIKKAEIRKKKREELEVKLQNSAGFYCNCKLSSTYKKPEFIPPTVSDLDRENIGKYSSVHPTKNGDCPFCGYTPVYFQIDPNLSKGDFA